MHVQVHTTCRFSVDQIHEYNVFWHLKWTAPFTHYHAVCSMTHHHVFWLDITLSPFPSKHCFSPSWSLHLCYKEQQLIFYSVTRSLISLCDTVDDENCSHHREEGSSPWSSLLQGNIHIRQPPSFTWKPTAAMCLWYL